MSDQAVKSAKAITDTQGALKRQTEATQVSLKQQLAALDQTRTRFQSFVGTVGQGAQRVSSSWTAMGAALTRVRTTAGSALAGVESRLQSFGSTVSSTASRMVSSFSLMGAAMRSVQSLLLGIGSAVALGGFTRLAKDAIDTTSTLVDTADRLGITIEALQELQFAAGQSGIGMEEFATGMQTFSRRLAEAAAGGGPLRKTLEGLGLNAKALAQDPAQALGVFADKIAGINSQAQRLNVARDAFAGMGPVFVNLLQQGGPAIDAVRQKLRDLGGVMGGDLARETEALGDRFDAATGAIGVQFRSALVELAPILIRTAELLAKAARGARQFIEDFDISKLLKRAQLTAVTNELERIEQKLSTTGGLSVTDRLFGTDEAKLQKRAAELRDSIKSIEGALTDWSKVTSGTSGTAIKTLIDDTAMLTEEQIQAKEAIERSNKSLREHADTLNLSGEALAKYHQAAVLKATGDKALADETYKAVLADEAAKKSKEDLTEATRKQAEADREAARIKKETATDLRDAELLVNKLTQQKFELDKQEAKANAAGVAQRATALLQLQEESQLLAASIGPRDQLRALELQIAEARIERASATERAALEEGGLTDEEQRYLTQKEAILKANAQTSASYTAMSEAINEAAFSTNDLKTITSGILQGTQDLSTLFEDVGQTLGVRLVDGILWGKGQDEKAIIGNFNTLLSVDAAGLFSTQGAALGGTLVSSIKSGANRLLQSAGIDLGGLFGSSFGQAAGATAGADFGNVIAGGSSTAASAGGAFGSIFGGAAAGAAGIALGKGLSGFFGVGGSKSGGIGGTVGGIAGGIGGFILGGPLGAAAGGALGTLFGGFIGDLFAHTPSRGTQIRKGVKDFLKEIEVSFADEIKSGNYFFEETKDLAEEMFGGSDGKDFLKASKIVLERSIGPELSKQLTALGTFLTADQSQKLGKSVEQSGTTFGNLLLDNLGLNPETIDAAIQETVQKAGISLDALAGKLTGLFTEGEISQQFYNDAIAGAVQIFNSELPDAINVAALALRSFSEGGLFDIEKFNAELAATTGTFTVIVESFIDVVRTSKPGEDVGKLLAQQITKGLEDLAVTQFVNQFVKDQLFAGIDLSNGIDAAEAELLKQRAAEAAIEVGKIRDAFGGVGEEVDAVNEKVDDLYQTLRDLTQQRITLRVDVLGDLEAIGAITGVQAAQAQRGAGIAGVSRARAVLAGGAGASDVDIEEGARAVRAARQATVNLFRAQEQAARAALATRIAEIHADYDARRSALQREAQAAQAASEARIQALSKERDQTQELFQARLDGLREELQIAQDFRRVAEGLQQTINQLVQSASPFSQPEQLAAFQRQAAELRAQIASAPPERQAQLIEELGNVLSTQLQIGKEFLDPTAFGVLFNSVVSEMERLRDQATTSGDRVESIQQQIADTTVQMDAALRSIDTRIEQTRADAQAAQAAYQAQAEALSEQERLAVAQAEASTNAEIETLRLAAVEEIRKLAVIEDQLLAEQIRRAQEQAQLDATQIGVLQNLNVSIENLNGSIIGLLDSIIGAKQGYEGVVTHPQLFLAHPGEHVRIAQGAPGQSQPVTVNVSVPIAMSGPVDNPRAAEEAIIQAVADDIRSGGKIRRALQGGRR